GRGVKLTYTAYFVKAAVAALSAVPEVNSRFHDEGLELFSDINIGIGTALGDEGLIVPVIHRAQEMTLGAIAGKLQTLTDKARKGELGQDEVSGGTFTISNHGVSGSLMASPIIINQPQNAILGIGKLEKRVVVVEADGQEQMEIRPLCYVTLTIDHRALDAHQTNKFLSVFVATLESWAD
ncbi:MAG: 2-oxo acid dehydrogenase subunit E2, partial [Gammaproteobacteria bacterium]